MGCKRLDDHGYPMYKKREIQIFSNLCIDDRRNTFVYHVNLGLDEIDSDHLVVLAQQH